MYPSGKFQNNHVLCKQLVFLNFLPPPTILYLSPLKYEYEIYLAYALQKKGYGLNNLNYIIFIGKINGLQGLYIKHLQLKYCRKLLYSCECIHSIIFASFPSAI